MIHEMNSEEWECGDDCLALILCVCIIFFSSHTSPQSMINSQPNDKATKSEKYQAAVLVVQRMDRLTSRLVQRL
jgi:hypothetical protein